MRVSTAEKKMLLVDKKKIFRNIVSTSVADNKNKKKYTYRILKTTDVEAIEKSFFKALKKHISSNDKRVFILGKLGYIIYDEYSYNRFMKMWNKEDNDEV